MNKSACRSKTGKMAENNTVVEATWNDVQLEDSLGMEVGYRLIPMVDFQQDGELLGRIRSIRKKFAQRWGFCRQWYTFATIWICNLPAIAF
ncbi:hypothetical protein DMI65_10305 [Escherichia coli]|nr:hypothetical protein [Escherichia coli]